MFVRRHRSPISSGRILPQTAFVGQVLLNYALENASYNWRDLPNSVLAFYLAICEDYEQQTHNKENRDHLPRYLNS